MITSNAEAQKNDRPEVGKYCKVYRDGEGLRVTITRIGKEKDNEVLIGIQGIDHSWDKKIFKAKVTGYDDKLDYTISHNGKTYIIITYRGGYGSGYSIYLPKENNVEKTDRRLVYDEAFSNECKPEWLLTEYLEQKEKQ